MAICFEDAIIILRSPVKDREKIEPCLDCQTRRNISSVDRIVRAARMLAIFDAVEEAKVEQREARALAILAATAAPVGWKVGRRSGAKRGGSGDRWGKFSPPRRAEAAQARGGI